MPCRRHPQFNPNVAVEDMHLDASELREEGFVTFDDIPKLRIKNAVKKSGMNRYMGDKYNDRSPSLRRILTRPEDIYLSGEIISCDTEEEGRLTVNVVCSNKPIDEFKQADDKWYDLINGTFYKCYGWSDIGWK